MRFCTSSRRCFCHGILVVLCLYVLFMFSNWRYSESTPSRGGILRYLWSHGIFDVDVNVHVDESGIVRQVMVYKKNFSGADDICSQIHTLTDYSGWCETFDLQKMTNCTHLANINIGWGTFLNEHLLPKFPIETVCGFVTRPLDDGALVDHLVRHGSGLKIRLTHDNLSLLCECDYAEIYDLFISQEVFNSLTTWQLEALQKKSFRSINSWRPEFFWGNVRGLNSKRVRHECR